MLLKKKYLFIISFTLFVAILQGQDTKATVKNIDFTVNELEEVIEVSYDIVNASPIEEFTILLAFVDDTDYYIYPTFVRGDVGSGVSGGKNKKIIWEYSKEDVYLGRIKAIVYTESVALSPGGSVNGLLSLALPGLGDQYVSYTKDNLIRPVYITAACYSMIGLGVIQKVRSNTVYNDYNNSIDPSEFNYLYNQANNLHQQSLVLTSIGVGLWVYDILKVTYRGMKNTRSAKQNKYSAMNHMIISPGMNGLVSLGYQLTF